ncbi:MAG TPA: T9SS type A sorting domain-containing protein [Bacteroidales bacterium]|nr:T9SS type A sorting domain-containing protein [Bacteroidales bacterium]
MKNLRICLSMMLLFSGLNSILVAQPQYYNFTGSGNGTNNFPFNVAGGKDVQMLYLAGEFNQPSAAPAGNIVSIAVFMNTALGPATYTDLTIKLGQSTITSLTAGTFYTGPMTTVYYHASVVLTNPASSWITFVLDSPFPYDPTQSLIVDIGQCGGTGTLGGGCAYTNQTGVRRVWSVGGCPFTPYNGSNVYNYNFGINIAVNLPIVVTNAATAITSASATLNGTANANNSATTVSFEYGLTTAYGSTIAGVPATVTGNTVTPITASLTGLLPNTTYHYRIKGVNANGDSNGNDMTFTTSFPPPTVVTTAVTAIGLNGATLNGTVNANGAASTVIFEYGLTTNYGSTITAVPPSVTGTTVTPVTGIVSGLLPVTLYHYRVVATNSGGFGNGNDMTFTTGGPPTVVTNPASNIMATTAQLNGTVTANNVATTVSFEWGLTTTYGNVAPAVPAIVNGTTPATVQANIAGLTSGVTYHFRCVGVNAGGTVNGADQFFLAGCPPVGPAGPITGPASMCAQSTGNIYAIAPITNATSYTWTVPAGATITAGAGTTTITVTFGSTAGNVSVFGTGPCGNGTASNLAVTVNPLPVPVITGPANACQGSTTNVYATQAGMTGYTWSVSAGGSITAGAGTANITVKWNTTGSQSVSVAYTNASGCTAAIPSVYAVTVNPSPVPTITGPASLCVNAGYIGYSTEPDLTGYTWTVSPGGSIFSGAGTSQIMVSWNQSGNQFVTVNYTSPNGCQAGTPTQLNVTVNPLPGNAGAVTGNAAVCAGAQGIAYSTTAIANATSYVWNLPSGASIASGDGTTNITVNFAADATSGNITVHGNNLCGNGTPSAGFAVTVNPLPAAAGSITGNAQACLGSTGNIFSVVTIANATGYTWSLPTGASITAGQNTNAITVSFGAGAVSGNITVKGTNTCGDGQVSSAFEVTVSPVPPKPSIIANGPVMTSSAFSGNQWYFSVTPDGAGAPIAGAIWPYYLASQSGYYWIIVTEAGCSSLPSERVQVIMTGSSELPGVICQVFPVPNDGRFTVSLTTAGRQKVGIAVYDQLGLKILDQQDVEVDGRLEKQIDLRPAAPGVYTIVFTSQDHTFMKKVVVDR